MQYAVIMLLLAVAVASPWFIKAQIQEGNPIYPFKYHWFGAKNWSDSSDLVFNKVYGQSHLLGVRTPLELMIFLPEIASTLFVISSIIPEHSVAVGFGLLLVVVFIWTGLVAFRRKKTTHSRQFTVSPACVYVSAVLVVLLTSFVTKQLRFHIFSQICLIYLTAFCLVGSFKLIPKTITLISAILVFTFIVVNGSYSFLQTEAAISYVVNGGDRSKFISSNMPLGEQLMEIAPEIPDHGHVLTFWDPCYPLQANVSLANPFQQGIIPWLDLDTPDALLKILNKWHFTHVLYFPEFRTNHPIEEVAHAALKSNELLEKLIKKNALLELARSEPLILYEIR